MAGIFVKEFGMRVSAFTRGSLFVVAFSLCALGLGAENIRYEELAWEKNNRYASAWSGRTNATFRTQFFVPLGRENARWMFEAEGAAGNFSVKVNGRKIGEAQAPVIRLMLANVKAGTNTVEFFATREYEGMETISPATNPYRERRMTVNNENRKYHNYHLGFRSECRIIELSSPVDVRMAWAETSYRNKKITIKGRVDATETCAGVMACVIRDRDGRAALRFSKPFTFEKGERRFELESAWANPKLWDVGQGNLYVAEVRFLSTDGREIDALKPFRFGFRELWTEGRTVMLNGHPLHVRIEMAWLPVNDLTFGFFRYLGRNAHYLQPHPKGWWSEWGETPGTSHKMFDFYDENGIVTFYSTVQVSPDCELLRAELHESYSRNLNAWMDIFRNHPSIIAWCVSMNAYNPKGSIVPNLLGRREEESKTEGGYANKQANIRTATRLCKAADPTRLVYAHADGNLGDVGSGNCYPNWTPLQEVIEYPLAWTRDGDMPWFAVEYGVYCGSFFKDQSLLLTEYAAIYFGERAYEKETLEQLEKTLALGIEAKHHGGNLITKVAPTSSLYWDLIGLTTEGTDRYWRAYGMFGWLHFFHARYGQPEKWKLTERTEPTKAPTWANPLVEKHAKNMQDLLVFIGGDDVVSDQTHSFYEGEEVRKNVVCVWDAANATNVTARWTIANEAGAAVARGERTITIQPGTVARLPIRFTVPTTGRKTKYRIALTATNRSHTMTDTFQFEAFPRGVARAHGAGKVYLLDPKGKSPWVRQVIPDVCAYADGRRLGAGDVLIIGREALKNNDLLPYRMADVAKGARVLILEQSPVLWEAFGFRMVDMMTRDVYETPYSRELMDGLAAEDLRYWRGSPNLLPEYAHVRDVIQPPRGVNRHGVASTVFEIPDTHGFEPLFQCEFDLRYSPLLRFRSGAGCVYYSSFDFTDRFGVDPAATALANNLLKRVLRETAPAERIAMDKPGEGCRILVNDGKVHPGTDEFLKAGGIVLNVALRDADLTARGVKFEKRRLYRAQLDGELAEVATRNMFRWRDALEVNCIAERGAACDGVWYRRGNEVFLQVASRLLEGRYGKDDRRLHGVMPTMLILDILKSRVLTRLGARPEARICTRLDSVCSSLPYRHLKDWYAYGPFRYTNATCVARFKDVLPGERQAISGDMNPNFTYRVEDNWKGAHVAAMDEATRRKTFDFRTQVNAGDDGYVDLAQTMGLDGKAAYCYLTHVWEEKAAGEAVFSFTFPSKAIVYLNGEQVFSGTFAHYGSGAKEMPLNALPIRLKLKAGENALTVKLATLPADMVSWKPRMSVTRSLPGITMQDVLNAVAEGNLYSEKGNINYAYRYYWW